MKILALEKESPDVKPEQFAKYLKPEAKRSGSYIKMELSGKYIFAKTILKQSLYFNPRTLKGRINY